MVNRIKYRSGVFTIILGSKMRVAVILFAPLEVYWLFSGRSLRSDMKVVAVMHFSFTE